MPYGEFRERRFGLRVVGLLVGVIMVLAAVAGGAVGSAPVAAGAPALLRVDARDVNRPTGFLIGNGGELAVPRRGAPSLPFRGMVAFYHVHAGFGAPPDLPEPELHPYPGFGLQYWNAVDSSLSYVPLGDDYHVCNGSIDATPDGIEIELSAVLIRGKFDSLVRFFVPWGDHPYPMFGRSPSIYRQVKTMQIGEDLRVERVGRHDFRFSISGEERHYTLDDDAASLRHVGSTYTPEPTIEDWEASSAGVLAGTDGEHYGIGTEIYEPACGSWFTIVVAAATGELRTCGWSVVSSALANFDDSYGGVEDPVFPLSDLSEGDRCHRILDLRDMLRQSSSGQGDAR